jgi:low temperature requirement protein LtrA
MAVPIAANQQRARRASPTVSWFELFYDLVVVAAVSLTNDAFLSEPSIDTARAAVLGIISLSWVWFVTTLFNNVYPGQDMVRRLLMLCQMALIVAAALAIDHVDGVKTTAAMLCYSGALVVVLLLIGTDRIVHHDRAGDSSIRWMTVIPIAISAALCAIGAFASPYAVPWILSLALVASIVPIIGWEYRNWQGDERLRLGHLRERLGLFIIIILGEGFAALVAELRLLPSIPRNDVFALTFLVSFALWWIYFDGTFSDRRDLVRIRWRLSLLGHLMLIFGMAGTLDILVLVTAKQEVEYGPLVLPYFAASIALVLLSFALLRFSVQGRLGAAGTIHLVSGLLILAAGLLLARQHSDALEPLIGACAVIVIVNGLIGSWMDREAREGGLSAQVAALVRGYDEPEA